MTSIRVQIQGVDRVRAKARKIVDTLNTPVHTREIAEYTRNVATQLAPKDTGKGAKGIHVEVHGVNAEVVSNDLHMYVMEYGRRAGSQKPSTSHVAGWASRHGWPKSALFLLASTIGRRGIRARGFMRKAASLAKIKMDAYASETIKVRIERIWGGG